MWHEILVGAGKVWARAWVRKVLIALIAIVVASVVGSIVVYVAGAERAKGRLAEVERLLAAAETAAEANSKETEKCLLLNEANAREARLQADRARQAADRVRELERSADRRVVEVDREANTLRASGLSCPALNDDFRNWMLDRS